MVARTAGTAATADTLWSTSAERIWALTSSPDSKTVWEPSSAVPKPMPQASATLATASRSARSTPLCRQRSVAQRYMAPVSR